MCEELLMRRNRNSRWKKSLYRQISSHTAERRLSLFARNEDKRESGTARNGSKMIPSLAISRLLHRIDATSHVKKPRDIMAATEATACVRSTVITALLNTTPDCSSCEHNRLHRKKVHSNRQPQSSTHINPCTLNKPANRSSHAPIP